MTPRNTLESRGTPTGVPGVSAAGYLCDFGGDDRYNRNVQIVDLDPEVKKLIH